MEQFSKLLLFMHSLRICVILPLLCSLMFSAAFSEEKCRYLEFKNSRMLDGQRLVNHVIQVNDVKDRELCAIRCFMEPNCVSYNIEIKPKGNDGTHRCELNDVTHVGNSNDLVEDQRYIYRGVENICVTNPCKNNATCHSGYADKGYHCLCTSGFKGQICDEDIDECATENNRCSANAVCNNIKGSYNCKCKPGYSGDGRTCKGVTVSSCREAYEKKLINASGVATLLIDSIQTSVFCHVGDFGCGGGVWTPVMKIDGNKQTFHYDSNFWGNKKEYNLPGGETGFDQEETKLPTYWNTSFAKICLGMKVDQQLRFVVISMQADSLHSLISDGHYRSTSLGRDTWKSLIGPQGSLQPKCNKEGFNVEPEISSWKHKASRARIGIVANNNNNCLDVDSRIGFGTGGPHDNKNTCGIDARMKLLDNGERHIKAMGYIFVQ